MWLRITSQYEVFYSDKFLINKYGGHDDQLSKALSGIENYRAYAIEKLLKYGSLNKVQYATALEMLLKKLEVYKAGLLKRDKSKELIKIEKKIQFWSGNAIIVNYIKYNFYN